MFEVHKRHTPMFTSTEIKRIGLIMAGLLGLDDLNFLQLGVELSPIFQTARINENNQFIVKSQLSLEKVMQVIQEDPLLKKLRAYCPNSSFLPAQAVKKMVEQFGIDSYFCIGEQKSMHGIDNILGQATEVSQKPLIIFNSSNEFQYHFNRSKWYNMDHPAIWLENSLGSHMAETEAFFAISPALKIEIGLNRYQLIDSFGSFAIGMVRF